MVVPRWGVLSLLLAACGPQVGADDVGGSASSTRGDPGTTTLGGMGTLGTTGTGPMPGTTVAPGDTTHGSTDEWHGFDDALSGNDLPPASCDIYEPSCPRGEKCTLWSGDGSRVWNETRCVPVIDDPDAPGQPCTWEGSPFSSLDSCGFGAICWSVDPETGVGTCIEFCMGPEGSGTCRDPLMYCAVREISLCRPWCQPLLQDCEAGYECAWAFDEFTCVFDGSGDMGAPGDPCADINHCDPGNACVPADWVPDCTDPSCCTSLCSLADPTPPCLPGQQCVPWPWFEDGTPDHHADLGVCSLP